MIINYNLINNEQCPIYMSTNFKNKQLTSVGKSTKKGSVPMSSKKVMRNLKQQFDQYVLNEQQEQDNNVTGNEPAFETENNQQNNYTQSGQRINQSHQKLRRKSSMRKVADNINNSKSYTKSKSKLRYTQYQPNTVAIPKSYILAMQHLQGLVEHKSQQINSLKQELVQKQQIILQSEQKINQILLKYHQLMDMFTLKQNQVIILKQQMQQLRLDKNTALKQAAKAIQPVFKPYNNHQVFPLKHIMSQQNFTTFKQRSISMQSPYKQHVYTHQKQPSSAFQSKDLGNQPIQPTFYQQSRDVDNFNGMSKLNKENNLRRSQHTEKVIKPIQRQNQRRVQSIRNYAELPSVSSRAPLLTQKSTNRDFISYQRQILRNEKQLIALKYRMECLQRKLTTDPRQQGIKQKLRKLSTEIDNKQRMINDLKRI